jgi:hypothetical protein
MRNETGQIQAQLPFHVGHGACHLKRANQPNFRTKAFGNLCPGRESLTSL